MENEVGSAATRDEETVGPVTIRLPEGSFDELVGNRVNVHVEILSDDMVWIGIDGADDPKRSMMISFAVADGKLVVAYEDCSE